MHMLSHRQCKGCDRQGKDDDHQDHGPETKQNLLQRPQSKDSVLWELNRNMGKIKDQKEV